MLAQNKRIIYILSAVLGLLLIPYIAMQISDEWNWTAFDFIFAFVLLFGSGLTYELVSRKSSAIAYKAAVGMAVVTVLMLVWVNLAVGIIGSEDNPANLLYFGVLAVGFIGAILARLEPPGMMRTLLAMTIAQLLVPVIALIIWKPSFAEPPGIVGVFALSAFFAVLFAGSALLFRHASATGSKRVPA